MSEIESGFQGGQTNVLPLGEQMGYVRAAAKEDSEQTKKMKAQFGFFGPATLLYAAFYAFCMYRNGSGITFPFFMAGSLFYICVCLGKLTVTLKRGSAYYMISIMLLAISTFCTADGVLIFFNKTGIFLLSMLFLLKQFYDTTKWGFGKFVGNILLMVFEPLGEIARPFQDAGQYAKSHNQKNSKMTRTTFYVLVGLVIALPLFAIVMLLLSSADAVFRQIAEEIYKGINFADGFGILCVIGIIFFVAYMLLAFLCKHSLVETVSDKRTGEPIIAIVITGMLSCVYLLFSGIQIVYLFVGNMELPEGYTYAMYAREGFFQLLFVSCFNLIIVLICLAFVRKNVVLKGILTIMSLCTFVMIASSVLRMIMYIRFYYLTFLRVFVLWTLLLLALLFVGVLITIYKEKFPLFRYGLVVVTVLYIGFSFLHPDYLIAKVNIANTAEHKQESSFFLTDQPYKDYSYLAYMSADAAPIIIPYIEELGENSVRDFFLANDEETLISYYPILRRSLNIKKSEFGNVYLEEMGRVLYHYGIRSFNLSKSAALAEINKYK